MSSSILAESIDNTKSDTSVIIFVNSDGTLTVDQVTLQTLLSNQNNVPLNVVKVTEKNATENVTDGNNSIPQVNLQVEEILPGTKQPPAPAAVAAPLATAASPAPTPASVPVTIPVTVSVPAPSTVVTTPHTTSASAVTTPVDGDIDPFLEMDPVEVLERLETALHSEHAKQILGDNVTAMLDMLNVEDDSIQLRPPPTTPTTLATSVKEAIRMDHCYTTLTATITSPVRPSETIGTSPVLLNTNTNTARVRGRGRGGFRGASRGRGRTLETAKIPVIEPPPPPPVENLLAQEIPVSPLRQAPSPLAIDDTIAINTVNQTTSAKVVVSKLPDIIDGTSAGLTLTEAMLDAKLQETQPEFTTYPAADEDSSEEITQSQDEEENEEEEEEHGNDDSSSDQDFVISPQKRTPTAVRGGRGRKEHLRGGIRRRGGRGRGRGGAGAGQPINIIDNQIIERSPPKKTEEHTSPVQSTRRLSTEKKIKIKLSKEPVVAKEPSTSTSTPTTPTTTTVPITISRTVEITKELQQKKNYPKRENRKPPAHLADSFGPALFSTPDIIRRVSTGEKDSPEKKNPKDDERLQLTIEANSASGQDLSILNPPTTLTDCESVLQPTTEIQPRGGSVEITQDSSGPFEMNSTILSLTSEDPETLATPLRQSKRQNTKTRRQSGEKPVTKNKRPSVDTNEGLSMNSTLVLVDNVEDDEGTSEDESWNSEDDPDRLWCICKKPHNNRFMICCDQCEDWFHGKCVGVTKALGKQMEEQGIEWSCPNCKKLKEMKAQSLQTLTVNKTKSGPLNLQNVSGDKNTVGTKKLVQQQLNVIKLKVPNTNAVVPKTVVTSVPAVTSASSNGNPGGPNQQTNTKNETPIAKALCIVCKKEARVNSIYCSDTCILKHAQDSQAQPPSKSTSQSIPAKSAIPTSLPGAKAAALNIKKAAVEVKGSRPLVEKPVQSSRPLAGLVKETPVPTSSPSLHSSNPSVKKGRSAAKASYQAEVALKQKTLMVQQGGRVVISPTSPSANTQNPMVSKAPATSTVKEAKPQKKIDSKRVSTDKEKEKEKDKEKDREEHKVSGPEPIRVNVRKTIQVLLQTRVKETKDLDIPEDKIKKIALNVEEELYSLFGDTGVKYKSKYRSLVFNIKDPKNLTLFRKIVEKSITPYQLVRLSPEELASQELAEWREREAKHQLEIIQKNELDLLALGKTYVMKTHKGEQFIESEEGLKTESALDLKNEDLVNVLNNSVSSTVEDQEPEKKKEEELKKERHEEKKKDKERKDKKERKESRDSRKDRDRDRRREKEKRRRRSSDRKHDDKKRDRRDRSREKDKDRNKEREKERERDKDKDKENEKQLKVEKIASTEPITSEKVPRDDSDQSDREPSSTVNIKTPDINGEEPMISTTPTGPPPGPSLIDSPPLPAPPPPVLAPSIWKGYINMPDVSKFYTNIHVAYGNADNLSKDMPEAADIVGRISPETVWEYMAKMKRSATKEIVVVYMSPATDEDKSPYITLYNYLNSRSRLGVIGNLSRMIKDFYLMPLPANESIPKVLLPVEGPGFGDSNRNLLIGILVRARRKRILPPEATYMARNKRPLIVTEASSETGGYTPPQSPTLFKNKEKESVPVVPPPPPPPALGNEDEPYSPGQADGEESNEPKTQAKSPPTVNEGEDLLTEPKSSTDLHRKMEEINRQIAESKRQIQTMSSTLTTDNPTSTNSPLPVLTKAIPSLLTPEAVVATAAVVTALTSGNSKKLSEKEDDDNEAYSPSRSFTPPTTTNDSIPFLGASSEGSTNVLAQLPSNISLPSNLSEILASIKKRECESIKIDLNSDPIVQSYKEATSPIEDEEDYEPKSKSFKLDINEEKKSLSSSATSSPSLLDSATESRDPRQRAAAARGPQDVSESSDSSGSKLSKLTDDELIRKAMEMEAIEAHSNVPPPSLTKKEKPLIVSPAIHKIMNEGKSKAPSPQPKPPGLEDEPQPEFTGYPPPPPLAFTNKPPPGPTPGPPIPFPNMGPRHPRFFPPHGGPPHPGPPHGPPHGGLPHPGLPHGGPSHPGLPHGGPPHPGPPHGGPPHQGPPHGGPLHQGPPHGGPPHQGPLHGGPPHPHPGMFRAGFRPPPPGHPSHLRPHMGPHGHSGPPRHPGHPGQFRPPPLWDSNISRPPPPHLMNFRKHDSDISSSSPSYSNQGPGSRARSSRWDNKSENKDSNKVSSVKRMSSGDMDTT